MCEKVVEFSVVVAKSKLDFLRKCAGLPIGDYVGTRLWQRLLDAVGDFDDELGMFSDSNEWGRAPKKFNRKDVVVMVGASTGVEFVRYDDLDGHVLCAEVKLWLNFVYHPVVYVWDFSLPASFSWVVEDCKFVANFVVVDYGDSYE